MQTTRQLSWKNFTLTDNLLNKSFVIQFTTGIIKLNIIVTKEELNESIKTLQEKFNYIGKELESLWQYAQSNTVNTNSPVELRAALRNIADHIEQVQFDGVANSESFTNE